MARLSIPFTNQPLNSLPLRSYYTILDSGLLSRTYLNSEFLRVCSHGIIFTKMSIWTLRDVLQPILPQLFTSVCLNKLHEEILSCGSQEDPNHCNKADSSFLVSFWIDTLLWRRLLSLQRNGHEELSAMWHLGDGWWKVSTCDSRCIRARSMCGRVQNTEKAKLVPSKFVRSRISRL